MLISLLVNAGDVVMMTSALDLLRQGLPQSRLDVLARPESAELLCGNPVCDQVIVYPYKSGSPFHGLGTLVKEIRRGGYATFFSLDRRPRGAAAAFAAGIPERIGPKLLFAGSRPEFWTRLLYTSAIEMKPDDLAISQVEMFQRVARRGFDLKGRGRITLPPENKSRAERAASFLPRTGGPVIGLCVRTNDPVKTWAAEGYAGLIRQLHAKYSAAFYITGGPGDKEYADSLISLLDGIPIKNLAGETTLLDIPSLAVRSDLFITPDNATGHLVGNSGLKNIICLLRATTPEFIAESLPSAKFISLGAAEPNQDALETEAGLVLKAAQEMLDRKTHDNG